MAYHRSCVHVIEPRGGAACTGYDVGHELEARQAGKGVARSHVPSFGFGECDSVHGTRHTSGWRCVVQVIGGTCHAVVPAHAALTLGSRLL
jgi:hypothetical protein